MPKWTIRDRKTLYSGNIFTAEHLNCHHPGKGLDHDFIVLNTPEWINVVAITEDGRFIMVKQHRLGTDEYTLETPAGLAEPGEDPMEAARRELREETGYMAKNIALIKSLTANPSCMSTVIHFYCATGCAMAGAQSLDPAEDIEVLLYTESEILNMLSTGAINHSIIVTALSMYFLSTFHNGDVKPRFS